MNCTRVFRCFGVGLLLQLCAAQPTSEANDASAMQGIRLSWARAPEAVGCPDAASVEADVTRRLGKSPFQLDGEDSVEVYVTYQAGVWEAAIEDRPAEGVGGSRVVTSSAPSCDSLAAAAGLAIALLIRNRANNDAEDSARTPPPALPPEPVPPVIAKPEATAQGNERTIAVFGAGVGALSFMPEPAIGGALLSVVPLAERLSLSAAAVFLPEQRFVGSQGTYGFGATWASVGGCYDVAVGAQVRASACLSAALGASYIVVLDPVPVRPGAHGWGALSVGPRLEYNPRGAFHLLLEASAVLPLSRKSYLAEREGEQETIFVDPKVGGTLLLGVGVQL